MIILRQRGQTGVHLVETMAAIMILVPIVLLGVDGAFVFIANRANTQIAQRAARMAANKPTQAEAETAAANAVANFEKNPAYTRVAMQSFDYDEKEKLLTVATEMDAALPVPVPGLGTVVLVARSAQPIVSIPAAR